MSNGNNGTTNSRTITALVQDKPGVLARISSLFRRRGFNIQSLAVGHSEQPGMSRMTFVVEGPPHIVRHVAAQLDKLIDVVEVEDISERNIVWRELALIKVRSTPGTRSEILELAGIFRVNVVDIGAESLTVEITGGQAKIDSLIELLKQYGVKEVMRTGRVAIMRGTLLPGEPDGEFQTDIGRSAVGVTPAPNEDSGSV
ncbi:MAG: acetolactate synthase small subunit [Dehalococcoidia bacterium]